MNGFHCDTCEDSGFICIRCEKARRYCVCFDEHLISCPDCKPAGPAAAIRIPKPKPAPEDAKGLVLAACAGAA